MNFVGILISLLITYLLIRFVYNVNFVFLKDIAKYCSKHAEHSINWIRNEFKVKVTFPLSGSYCCVAGVLWLHLLFTVARNGLFTSKSHVWLSKLQLTYKMFYRVITITVVENKRLLFARKTWLVTNETDLQI